MCGICGYVGLELSDNLLHRMMDALAHRGPDGGGILHLPRLGLGMRRLAIIDVTGGRQPLYNECGDVAVVLNGEIYNYKSLRHDLLQRGHRFATASDAEVVVHLYEERRDDCVDLLRGMFAFALYDRSADRLLIARDRLGIKPLYYWRDGSALIFASEIKALLESGLVPRRPCPASIDAYLSRRYVPGPLTMFEGVLKLPAAHLLVREAGRVEIRRYWMPPSGDHRALPDGEYDECFASIFEESMRLHRISDVPVGAYLSGGLDSSCVVAALAREHAEPVKTYAVGFGGLDDETAQAREVARTLGCEHHEVICRPEDFDLLPRIIWHADEPLGDAIVLPTFLLAREASRDVKVVLTGEGADELLAGYAFHRVIDLTNRYRRVMPEWMHEHLVLPLVRRLPRALAGRYFDYPATLDGEGHQRVLAYAATLHASDYQRQYRSLTELFTREDRYALYTPGFYATLSQGHGEAPTAPSDDVLRRLLDLQFASWLPDNILTRQDKMAMAHGLEARVPFLDHVLVEFLQSVPARLRLRPLGENKILLRRYARRRLPRAVARRRKRAFYMPAERFYGHASFRRLVAMTLNAGQVEKRGYFAPDAVQTFVAAMNRGGFLTAKQIVALVMLELWHMIFIDRTLDPSVRPPRPREFVLDGHPVRS